MARFFVENTELLTKHEYDSTRIGENLIKGSALGSNDAHCWLDNDHANWGPDFTVIHDDVIQNIPVKPNTTYTFSWFLNWLDTSSKDTGFYFVEQKKEGLNTDKYVDHRYTYDLGKIENSAGLHVFTFTTQANCNLLVMHIRYIGISPYGFKISQPKLEIGSVATPWCLAREDYAMQSDIINLQDQINQLKSKLGGVKPCYRLYYATPVREVA